MNIGITGQSGFIGTHLAATLRATDNFQVTEWSKELFAAPGDALRKWVEKCDVIVHLAGLSRHADGEFLYRCNMELTRLLGDALHECPRPVLFGSTTHIAKDTPYHASKRDGATLLRSYGNFPVCEMLMPNVFGPGSRPFHNSVVSTFCHLAATGEKPPQISDVKLLLISVDELCDGIIRLLATTPASGTVTIPHRHEIALPELWRMLEKWANSSAAPPESGDSFNGKLYRTWQSYCR